MANYAKKGKRSHFKRGAKRSKAKTALRRAPKKLKATIRAVVKQVEKRDAESKFRVQALNAPGLGPTSPGKTLLAPAGFSQAITSTAEIYTIIPEVLQGIDSSERIGDKITPTSLTVDLQCSLDNNDLSSNVVVDIYFLECKLVSTADNYTAIPITGFLRAGTNTDVTAYNGKYTTAMLPVDTNRFKVLRHIRCHLNQASFSTNQNATVLSGNDTNANPTGNSKFYRVKLPVPKVYSYVQNLLAPQNSYPFMVAGWHYGDAYSSSVGASLQPKICAQAKLWYKDM